MYRYQKIIKKDDTLKAEFVEGHAKTEHSWHEDNLRDIIARIDSGSLNNPAVLRSEFEKGLRALLVAKDGGLASLLDPGRLQ